MTPRHDKTPPPDSLTKSQQELVAITDERTADAIVAAVAKIHDQQSGVSEMAKTTPLPGDSSDMARKALTWFECETEKGAPAFKIGKRLDGIEERIAAMELARATEKAADEAMAKLAGKVAANRTVLISAAIGGASLLANVLLGIWKVRHGG